MAEIPDLLKNKTFLSKKLNIAAITSADGSSAVPISRSILIRAAAIRASTKLKLPDAIHAATAITTGCTTFLTNDKQFKTVKRLHTLLLSQVMTDSDEE
ncbi:MAG: PIN domain-containing protein [Phormidesmis sp.]